MHPSGRCRGRLLGVIAVAGVLLVQPASAASAQQSGRGDGSGVGSQQGEGEGEPREDASGFAFFPGEQDFAPLLAGFLESGNRGYFVLADRPDLDDDPEDLRDFEGRGVEAVVELGFQLPAIRFSEATETSTGIQLGFEVGIFSRFFMETSEKDLINTDFRVGFPLSVVRDDWEGRFEWRHISSHLGDDFSRRFDVQARTISMEGFELVLARRAGPGFRAYAAGEWNHSTSRTVERTAGRVGVEYNPRPDFRDGPHPYGGVELRFTDVTGGPFGQAVAGVGIPMGAIRLMLEGRGQFGASTMGQFRQIEENFWGLGLRLDF